MNFRFIKWWVDFRTSYSYIVLFIAFSTIWIISNVFLLFDEGYTRLNLIISLLTELQSIVLLIYVNNITIRNDKKSELDRKRTEEINNKLDKLIKM